MGAGEEEDNGGLPPAEDEDTTSVDLGRWKACCPLSTEGVIKREPHGSLF